MSARWTDQEIDAAVKTSVEESGLHPAFTPLVRQFALDGTDGWRVCCGMDCSPCVNELAPAVERVRELLGEAGV